MPRPLLSAALMVTLSACCMTDDPFGRVAFAVNRCAFSVSGLPLAQDGTDLNRTYIDENPTLERPAGNNTVTLLDLRCSAEAEGGNRVAVLLSGFRNTASFQILDSSPSATWEVRTSQDGDPNESFRGVTSSESSASIGVEVEADLQDSEDPQNLASSFGFSVVDYETGGEGTYVSAEGTTQ